MDKKALITDKAPRPIGPYSQAIKAGNLLFLAGQVSLDPATNEFVEGDIAAQTRRAMDNLMAVLDNAGLGPQNVVKVTVYLADMDDFAAMNEVYGTYFKEAPPARAAIQVSRLPKDGKVEIDMIALAKGGGQDNNVYTICPNAASQAPSEPTPNEKVGNPNGRVERGLLSLQSVTKGNKRRAWAVRPL